MKNIVAQSNASASRALVVGSIVLGTEMSSATPFTFSTTSTERSNKDRFSALWSNDVKVVKKGRTGTLYVKRHGEIIMTLAEAEFLLSVHTALKQGGSYVNCSKEEIQHAMRYFSPEFQPARYVAGTPDMKKMLTLTRKYVNSMKEVTITDTGALQVKQEDVTSADLLALKYSFDCVDSAPLVPATTIDKDALNYADLSVITGLANMIVNPNAFSNAMNAANRQVASNVEVERRNKLNQLYSTLAKYYELCHIGGVKPIRPNMNGNASFGFQLPTFSPTKVGITADETVRDALALFFRADSKSFNNIVSSVKDTLNLAVQFDVAKQVLSTVPVAKKIVDESNPVKPAASDFFESLNSVFESLRQNQSLLQLLAN